MHITFKIVAGRVSYHGSTQCQTQKNLIPHCCENPKSRIMIELQETELKIQLQNYKFHRQNMFH
jgi:hypothetical protein